MVKVNRICGIDESNSPAMIDFRVMNTTCPKCRQAVQFAMQEDDFLDKDNEFLENQNRRLRVEIHRLNMIINKLINHQSSIIN